MLDLNLTHDHHETLTSEEEMALDYLQDVATSVIRQAVEQGIAPLFASSTVLYASARQLCVAAGPATASQYLRHVANLIDGVDRPRVYDA